MITVHNVERLPIDLSECLQGHTADQSIIYKTVEGIPVRLGYFKPKNYNSGKKYPAFLMIHGGGWSSHKVFEDQCHWAGDYLGYLARYYADKNYVAISIDYRLINRKEETKPGKGVHHCYEDCCDAVEYIITHADKYGIDTEKMFILGESAGAHLVGGLITFGHSRRFKFECAFLVNPITDLCDEKWSWAASSSERKALSPLYQADQKTCRVVLMHGIEDITVNPKHSFSFYERLQELGVNSELHLIENTKHAFLLAEYYNEIDACKTAIQIINDIICK